MDFPNLAGIIVETPTGTINGINLVFTLSNTPRSGSLLLISDQIPQISTVGYNLSGVTITFIAGNAPNNSLFALYPKA